MRKLRFRCRKSRFSRWMPVSGLQIHDTTQGGSTSYPRIWVKRSRKEKELGPHEMVLQQLVDWEWTGVDFWSLNFYTLNPKDGLETEISILPCLLSTTSLEPVRNVTYGSWFSLGANVASSSDGFGPLRDFTIWQEVEEEYFLVYPDVSLEELPGLLASENVALREAARRRLREDYIFFFNAPLSSRG